MTGSHRRRGGLWEGAGGPGAEQRPGEALGGLSPKRRAARGSGDDGDDAEEELRVGGEGEGGGEAGDQAEAGAARQTPVLRGQPGVGAAAVQPGRVCRGLVCL